MLFDLEELENDFEEVELEAVETPAVAETSERLLADVAAATKTIYVSYIDENGVPVDGAEIEQVEVPDDAYNFNSSLLEKVPDCLLYTSNIAVLRFWDVYSRIL